MREGALSQRQDLRALWAGISFSLVWTGIIWLAGDRLAAIPKLPDQGAAWYFWKLPEPTFWSRFSAWALYGAHQIISWGLIWYAQRYINRYTTGLHKVNIVALAVNALFILLHFVQTHLWYDGLAQDTSIFASQASVIILLVWVLLMENRRRGLIWGKEVPISRQITDAARKYHGYIFSWAIVYTFWFHPMENSSGHLIGFFYMFLLMLQGSLFFTRMHVNRWWTLTQELLVVVHGTLVAVMNTGSQGLWPMFLFGFLGIFIITQMHGLGLGSKTKLGLLGLYCASAVATYSWLGFDRLNEIVRIPLIEYLAVLILAGLLWLVIKLVSVVQSKAQQSQQHLSS